MNNERSTPLSVEISVTLAALDVEGVGVRERVGVPDTSDPPAEVPAGSIQIFSTGSVSRASMGSTELRLKAFRT